MRARNAEGVAVRAGIFACAVVLSFGLIGVPAANANVITGPDDIGLGLANDPSGNNEISGTSLIRIAMAAGLTPPVLFQMGSVSAGDTWLVSGSNSATTGFALLVSGTDEISHTIPFFNFYTFNALAGNVLLASISASSSTWDFNVPTGSLGTTQPYTVSGITLTAAGFSSPAALAIGTPDINLFGNNASAVPEPSSAMLLAVGVLALLSFRRSAGGEKFLGRNRPRYAAR